MRERPDQLVRLGFSTTSGRSSHTGEFARDRAYTTTIDRKTAAQIPRPRFRICRVRSKGTTLPDLAARSANPARLAHWLSRTATVFDSPDLQVTLVTFRPSSGFTKMTVCDPADAETPSLGVPPSGFPSRTTLETGIELKLSVQLPPPPDALGAFSSGS